MLYRWDRNVLLLNFSVDKTEDYLSLVHTSNANANVDANANAKNEKNSFACIFNV